MQRCIYFIFWAMSIERFLSCAQNYAIRYTRRPGCQEPIANEKIKEVKNQLYTGSFMSSSVSSVLIIVKILT